MKWLGLLCFWMSFHHNPSYSQWSLLVLIKIHPRNISSHFLFDITLGVLVWSLSLSIRIYEMRQCYLPFFRKSFGIDRSRSPYYCENKKSVLKIVNFSLFLLGLSQKICTGSRDLRKWVNQTVFRKLWLRSVIVLIKENFSRGRNALSLCMFCWSFTAHRKLWLHFSFNKDKNTHTALLVLHFSVGKKDIFSACSHFPLSFKKRIWYWLNVPERYPYTDTLQEDITGSSSESFPPCCSSLDCAPERFRIFMHWSEFDTTHDSQEHHGRMPLTSC